MADVLLRYYLLFPSRLPLLSPVRCSNSPRLTGKPCLDSVVATAVAHRPQRLSHLKVHAVAAENVDPKWWEKNAGPNMIDIYSTQEFLDALSRAGNRLVIVEFYGTWCGSCRALYPKFQKIKDAIATHNTARCSIGPPSGVGDVNLLETSTTQEKPAEATTR